MSFIAKFLSFWRDQAARAIAFLGVLPIVTLEHKMEILPELDPPV
jgi:hypothetical protein